MQLIYNQMKGMSILKVIKEVSFSETPYVAQAELENGVKLLVRKDFSADGSDGKIYYNVFEDDGDILIPIGWSTEKQKEYYK